MPTPTRSASTSPSGVRHDGAVGHEQHAVIAIGTVAVTALAGTGVSGPLVRMPVVVEERRHRRVDDEDDVAAAAAVAAVGTAERLELLAMYRRAAVPAVAGGDVQHDAVDEGGGPQPPLRQSCSGTMLTTRRPRRVPNSTWPCGEREQGVVAAAADVQAGVEVGAALAHEDLAGVDELAAEALHAEPLRVGVTAVTARGGALLVCHVAGPTSPVSMPVTRTWVCR